MSRTTVDKRNNLVRLEYDACAFVMYGKREEMHASSGLPWLMLFAYYNVDKRHDMNANTALRLC